MRRYAASKNGNSASPYSIFDLICGASSGGIIALLLGRLGLDCGQAMVYYHTLIERLPAAQSYAITARCEAFSRILNQIIQPLVGETKDQIKPSPTNYPSKHTNVRSVMS